MSMNSNWNVSHKSSADENADKAENQFHSQQKTKKKTYKYAASRKTGNHKACGQLQL